MAEAAKTFQLGDRVRGNSEAGYVTGIVIAIHRQDFDFKGYTHHASPDHPQYELKSEKTGHVAAHRGAVLELLNGAGGA